MVQWHEVPADLLVHFLRFLPVASVCMVPQCCRAWQTAMRMEAALVDAILRDAAISRFPDLMKVPSAPQLATRDLFLQALQHERFRLWTKRQKLREGRGGTRHVVEHQRTGERAVMKLFDGRRELGMGFHEPSPDYLDEGIPQEVLREISTLKALVGHAHLVNLKDVYYRPPPAYDSLYLVYDCCECNLKTYIRRHELSADVIRSLTFQMLCGLDWCHSHRIVHRYLTPHNLFVNPSEGVLKLSGFSCARAMSVEPDGRTYTLQVGSLWYRAPELLLGDATYGSAIDVWSIGAIVPELLTNQPLFPGDMCEIDELFKIFRVLGTPTEATWAGVASLPHFNASFPSWRAQPLRAAIGVEAERFDDAGVELLRRCLAYRPSSRPTAREALGLPYFDGFEPQQIGRVALPEPRQRQA